MDNLLINRYIRLIEPLSIDLKLELLSAISASIKNGLKKPKPEKYALFMELKGAWSDIDDSIEDEIYSSRTISDKEISFD